jgi:hypothetical protein
MDMLKSRLRDAAELAEFGVLMALFSAILLIMLVPLTAYCLVKAGRNFRSCLSDILARDCAEEAYGEG